MKYFGLEPDHFAPIVDGVDEVEFVPVCSDDESVQGNRTNLIDFLVLNLINCR